MPNETMRAVTVYGPNDARMETVPKPVASGRMLVIKVSRTGVCATDFSIYTGESSFVRSGEITYPCRIGHEWAGVVESVGPAVTRFKPGDRVYADNFTSCGHCPACLKGDYMNCTDIHSVGTVNCWDGCFAEYMLMPEWHVYPLPDRVSMDVGALIEPASIAYDAFKEVTLGPDSTAVVYGTGAIGLISVWLAKYYGAGQVILIGRTPSKLERGKQVGADVTINSRETDPVAEVKALTGGKGAHLVVETSGSPDALKESFRLCRRYARISVVSFYERDLDGIPMDHLVLQNLKIIGAAGCYGNAENVCAIMQENPVSLEPCITHHVPFADCLDVFEHESNYHADKIKIMIDFD